MAAVVPMRAFVGAERSRVARVIAVRLAPYREGHEISSINVGYSW